MWVMLSPRGEGRARGGVERRLSALLRFGTPSPWPSPPGLSITHIFLLNIITQRIYY
jgi:hypothetical protein